MTKAKAKTEARAEAKPKSRENGVWKFDAKLVGTRGILFDRYPGDNDTKLKPLDKLYVNDGGHCIIPCVNLYSCLTAENTKSISRICFGKKAGNIRIGINSFVTITGDDSEEASVIRDDKGKPWSAKDSRITIRHHVARLKNGVPNPKERPCIPVPWNVTFHFEYAKNNFISKEALLDCLNQAGQLLGLGTFKPVFGKFAVEIIEK